MWWQIAAAAAPYVYSMFQSQPDAPSAPARVMPTARTGEVAKLLDAANNPNSAIYQQASDRTSEQVNRVLARQGLSGSAVAGQLQASTQAELANKWLEAEVARRNQALQTVMQYDQGMAGVANSNADAAYKYQMDNYNRQMQNNAGQLQAIGGLANAAAGAYGSYQADQRADARQLRADQRMDAMMAYYGVPGYQQPAQPVMAPATVVDGYAPARNGMYPTPYY